MRLSVSWYHKGMKNFLKRIAIGLGIGIGVDILYCFCSAIFVAMFALTHQHPADQNLVNAVAEAGNRIMIVGIFAIPVIAMIVAALWPRKGKDGASATKDGSI